eukprot:TRINITY_DN604_c0_g1_i10.p1 TRINITY_DN604_c0_g1~~TRINITY_DN604_c0_g1_i10.p1  ORF type:complete len:179 (+),score=33.38 TRINITY_DN604_c0_g1_i10:580-1116(+)
MFLDIALFTVYDYSLSFMDGKWEETSVTNVFFRSLLSGSIAGAFRGLLSHGSHCLWKPVPGNRLKGVVISSIFVNGVMFSSYETSKKFLMQTLNVDHVDYPGLISIAMAGGTAGVLQELAIYYSKPMKTLDTKNYFLQLKGTPFPQRSVFLSFPVLFSSTIGFLAYEYGKEFVLKKEE